VLAQAPQPPGTLAAERHYALYGLGLTIRAQLELLSSIDARLRPFAAGPELHNDLRFDFCGGKAEPDPSLNTALRAVYEPEQGDVVYDDAVDRLHLVFDGIHAVCDPIHGRTRVSLRGGDSSDRWMLSHPVLTLPLIEMLKRRGLYSVHAAGLSLGGRAVLVAGTSGAGKTTLTIALVRAGFDFLSDDMLFLSKQTGALQVHAFPDEVDVTETTARFFPELAPLVSRPRQPGWPKWSFRIETKYGVNVAWTSKPAALVLPRISHHPNSRLEPIGSDEALLELLPNVLLTESRACQAHLAALAQLTSETQCYRLWTGYDFDAAPGLLGALLV
jgi:hypothetical protein